MAESKEELKSLLMEVKEKSGKAGLKLKFRKLRSWHLDPITSWQIDGGKVLTLTEFFFFFFFLGSKITVDSAYCHKIKRCFLLGRKVMTNPDSVLKSRDIALLTKVHIVQAMVFSVVMNRCEG